MARLLPASVLLALTLLIAVAVAPQADAAAADDCLKTDARPPDMFDQDARDKAVKRWIEVCRQAADTSPDNLRLKLALARALSADGQRLEAVAIYRAAAAKGDAESAYQLYEMHKSYDRSEPGKPQLVTRAEAEAGLRKAAELGHPYSMWILAVLLDRGSTVKRDPAGAIQWAERAMAKPPKDTSAADIEVRLGHFLAEGGNPEERARGIAILERYSGKRGRGDAQSYLAKAIRDRDPARARALLEAGERTYPGHAIPALADMLLKGEGGPKDEKRALALLQGRRASDVGAVKAVLGRLYLEGRLVPRDVEKGVQLIRLEAVWDIEAMVEVARLLAANPQVRLYRTGGFLYDLIEAAELGEPGAMPALIDLKLSENAQFADKAGGCRLAEQAAVAGDAAAAQRLTKCRG
jgi:TPR repeat protein